MPYVWLDGAGDERVSECVRPPDAEPQPGTLLYAQMVAERYGDLDTETEEETR